MSIPMPSPTTTARISPTTVRHSVCQPITMKSSQYLA